MPSILARNVRVTKKLLVTRQDFTQSFLPISYSTRFIDQKYIMMFYVRPCRQLQPEIYTLLRYTLPYELFYVNNVCQKCLLYTIGLSPILLKAQTTVIEGPDQARNDGLTCLPRYNGEKKTNLKISD